MKENGAEQGDGDSFEGGKVGERHIIGRSARKMGRSRRLCKKDNRNKKTKPGGGGGGGRLQVARGSSSTLVILPTRRKDCDGGP